MFSALDCEEGSNSPALNNNAYSHREVEGKHRRNSHGWREKRKDGGQTRKLGCGNRNVIESCAFSILYVVSYVALIPKKN